MATSGFALRFYRPVASFLQGDPGPPALRNRDLGRGAGVRRGACGPTQGRNRQKGDGLDGGPRARPPPEPAEPGSTWNTPTRPSPANSYPAGSGSLRLRLGRTPPPARAGTAGCPTTAAPCSSTSRTTPPPSASPAPAPTAAAGSPSPPVATADVPSATGSNTPPSTCGCRRVPGSSRCSSAC